MPSSSLGLHGSRRLRNHRVRALAAAPATPPPRRRPAVGFDAARARHTRLKVTKVVTGLDIPWDVQALPGGDLLVTERDRARLSVVTGGKARSLSYPSDTVWVSGETGLMSIAVDPDFADNRRIYTCQGGFTASGTDVRVVAWRINAQQTA